MPKKQYQQASFIKSALKLKDLPEDIGTEVAIIGRSNAGKSSTLNSLTQQKSLAKVSKTPGRTQLINLFRVDDDRRLVDLPGYGFAKVAESIKLQWQQYIEIYLQERDCLAGLVVVMDIRHPLQPLDLQMLAWANECELPVHCVLTKADKLKRGPMKSTLLKVQREVEKLGYTNTTVQTLSNSKNEGIDELVQQLNQWFGY